MSENSRDKVPLSMLRAVTGYMGFLGAREQRSSIRVGLLRYCRRD